MSLPSIAVTTETTDRQTEAKKLAQRLGLPTAPAGTDKFDFVLVLTDKRLELRQSKTTADQKAVPGPVFAEFTSGPLDYRRRRGGGRGQPLARAVGLKKGKNPAVLDATGGLGRDAFVMANLGCRVLLIERSPVIAALLQDGLQRAAADRQVGGITSRIKLLVGDSRELLPKISPGEKPAVIYLDPMYPHRTKNALAKKEMRLLRAIAGEDQDATDLLAKALTCAANRVVVKRRRLAPAIPGEVKPTMAIKSKNSRFDVYLTNRIGL